MTISPYIVQTQTVPILAETDGNTYAITTNLKVFPNLFENRQAAGLFFICKKKNRINQTMFGKLTSNKEVLSMKMTKDIYGKWQNKHLLQVHL